MLKPFYLLFAGLLCFHTGYTQVLQKYFGRIGRSEFILRSAALANGNRIAVGYAYNGTNTVGSDAFVTCIDPADNVLWSKELATSGTDRYTYVIPTADSGCVAAGYANATGASGNPAALVTRFSAAGAVLWTKMFKNTSNGEFFFSVAEMPNGHIICGGSYNSAPGILSSLLVDLDAGGTVLWAKSYDGSGSDAIWGVVAKGPDIIATGYYQSSSYYDGVLLEVDESNGNIKWAHSFDYTSPINGNAGVWPQELKIAGNKIYADAYDFNAFGVTVDQHGITAFDTAGLNPVCLEYKFSLPVTGAIQSVVGPANELYLTQVPASATWDYTTSGSNAAMSDAFITKVKSMNASAPGNFVYCRKLGNTGEQTFRTVQLVSGKIVGFGGTQLDPANAIGTQDMFKVEADTSFAIADTNCVVDITPPQFANPTVTLNTAYTFGSITALTLTVPATALNITSVTLSSTRACIPEIIVNKYAAVTGRAPCSNAFVVDTATGFNAGDTVLMIQMKGATIDTTNTAVFGSVLNYNGAGNYEQNVIKNVSGNVITLKYQVKRSYDIPAGKVQFVRMANYQNYTVTQRHTCLPWTGTKGGILALRVSGTLTLNEHIDVSGKGFRGGLSNPVYRPTAVCNTTDYYHPVNMDTSAQKGEGIATVSAGKSHGRGSLANGGGGGNASNSGGGGGSNAGSGGLGGKQYMGCSSSTTANVTGGVGGTPLAYSTSLNRVFLGGGGGAGQVNEQVLSNGGAGGGIVFLNVGSISGNGWSVKANGGAAPECTAAVAGCANDGTGGGGGGGAILLSAGAFSAALNTEAAGGKGANVYLSTPFLSLYHGPGGGGGGGAVWVSSSAFPASVAANIAGGNSGVIPQAGNNAHGALSGVAGQTLIGLAIINPVDTFTANTLLPGFTDSVINCETRKFINSTSTLTTGISAYSWTFGDGGTSALTNPVHSYLANGTFAVKLIAIDSNGCKDSIIKSLTIGCTDTIINKYAAVQARLPCDNSFLVDTAAAFGAGDTILMIQMKGAVIDTSNNAAFGTVLAYNGAGNYEQNIIQSVSGNTIRLRYKMKRNYDIPEGRVQFVRIPRFQNYGISKRHTCLPWTGAKGGVFIINVTGILTLNDDITVSGKGFRGGLSNTIFRNNAICSVTDYYHPANMDTSAQKGEGITTVSVLKSHGRGSLANGGDGGNAHNTGGGGGSNAGAGGIGGKEFQGCTSTIANGGIGGIAATYTNVQNKVLLGGGGGAGHANNATISDGGNGGGIVIINAGTIAGNAWAIRADGGAAAECSGPTVCSDDGTGGGGGGGAILLSAGSYVSTITTAAAGGKGANVYLSPAFLTIAHGPGGGGGGGAVWVASAAVPGQIAANVSGGNNGVLPQQSNIAWGSAPGLTGQVLTGLQYVQALDSFKINGFNSAFTDSVVSCFTRKLLNASTTTATGISGFIWDAGSGMTSTLRSPTFTFPGYGTYPVTLVVIDSNGCRDTFVKNVVIPYIHFAQVSGDTGICIGASVVLTAGGGISYLWSPATALSDVNSSNPVATPVMPTAYTVTVTDAIGCVDTAHVFVDIVPPVNPITAGPADTLICKGRSVQLFAANGVSYIWSPADGLNNPAISNPVATVNGNARYTVTGRDANGCISSAVVNITEAANPTVDAFTDGGVVTCDNNSIRLYATGAQRYVWSPGRFLNDSTIALPLASPPNTTTFTVTGTNAAGCTDSDTITIFYTKNVSVFMPDAFTPNHDGLNDVIRPIAYCDFEIEEFRVFNRWGQAVFYGFNNKQAWNGTFRDSPAEMGVYFYFVKGHRPSSNQTIMYKGDFTLIR